MTNRKFSPVERAQPAADAGRENTWKGQLEGFCVEMVAAGLMVPYMVWHCPSGSGNMQVAGHIQDFSYPLIGCPCGVVHEFSSKDVEVVFGIK